MAQKSDSALQTQKDTIKTETTANANTALRVGTMYEDIIDSKINNDKIVDEDDMVSNSATLVPSQQSVKAYVDASGGGTVTSVSGTADRITSTGGATPVIDISATFEALLQKKVNAATVLTDGATIDLTAIKHTLTTASSRTFTISYTGDDIIIEVTLTATTATQTFPATALCISEGLPTGDNTLNMSGVSGDKYLIAIKKIGSAYYVVCKRFAQ